MKLKKTKKQILLNNRGSALQIVLVAFLVLFSTVFSYGVFMQNNLHIYKYERYMNTQRQIEIFLKRYFKETIDNDLLISDTIQKGDSTIDYHIEDMWDYYIITCDIKTTEFSYGLSMEMVLKDLTIRKYHYVAIVS